MFPFSCCCQWWIIPYTFLPSNKLIKSKKKSTTKQTETAENEKQEIVFWCWNLLLIWMFSVALKLFCGAFLLQIKWLNCTSQDREEFDLNCFPRPEFDNEGLWRALEDTERKCWLLLSSQNSSEANSLKRFEKFQGFQGIVELRWNLRGSTSWITRQHSITDDSCYFEFPSFICFICFLLTLSQSLWCISAPVTKEYNACEWVPWAVTLFVTYSSYVLWKSKLIAVGMNVLG